MKVEIFVPAYNGMHILPLFLDHYLERFPGCTINIYNDNSTDGTGDYCRSKGCNVIDCIGKNLKVIQ
jgi:glycosyltransferase involved in cell wall biosynthesis